MIMKLHLTIGFILSGLLIKAQEFTLNDFYSDNQELRTKTETIFNTLNDTLRVGQVIVPSLGKHGKPTEHVIELAKKGY